MSEPELQAPAGYRLVQPGDMTPGLFPFDPAWDLALVCLSAAA